MLEITQYNRIYLKHFLHWITISISVRKWFQHIPILDCCSCLLHYDIYNAHPNNLEFYDLATQNKYRHCEDLITCKYKKTQRSKRQTDTRSNTHDWQHIFNLFNCVAKGYIMEVIWVLLNSTVFFFCNKFGFLRTTMPCYVFLW